MRINISFNYKPFPRWEQLIIRPNLLFSYGELFSVNYSINIIKQKVNTIEKMRGELTKLSSESL